MENVRRRVDVKTEHSDEKKDFQIDSKFFVSKGLTRARVPQKDLCLFYITCVCSVIDYAAPVFHNALPAYLSQELARVQKRAMRIICPGIEYQQALALMSDFL